MAIDLNKITSQESVTETITSISGAVSDPFGSAIQLTINKISSLTVNIERKVDQLVKEVVQKTDSKGRVSLQGNNLVITVRKEDIAQAQELQKRVKDKIDSIKNTISILKTVITSLTAIQTAITVYKSLLDLQEVSLTLNPVTGPMFQVVKQGIKVVFLKEIINQYVKILGRQLVQNKQVLDRLISKFRDIEVSVKVQEEADKGSYVNYDVAEQLLADDALGKDIDQVTQDFSDNEFLQYIIKVEKYDKKQLIAVAREKSSGMIKAQTAPSYFSTPDQLIEELKTILNIGL
jgi:predicted Rdx family selenoprotein